MVRVAGVRLLTMPMSFGCEVHVGALFRATPPHLSPCGAGRQPLVKKRQEPFSHVERFSYCFSSVRDMFKSLDIQKDMEVVGLEGKHVGTVDHISCIRLLALHNAG